MKKTATSQRLKGLVALVTGGTKGIGKEITLRLAREGAIVLACGRDVAAILSVRSDAKDIPGAGKVMSLEADLHHQHNVDRLAEIVSRDYGLLDILVNNVGGVKQFGKFDEITDADWQEVFEDNLMTTVRMTRAALPLLKNSRHASIVNIASVAGVQAGWFNSHYGSMKAAQIHLTKYLANNYGRDGIRVNAVCPSTVMGGVWERDVQNKAWMDETSYEVAEERLVADVKAKSVLGTIGTPGDVAAAVAFLASDDARMITGSCFNIDGGTVKAI